MYCTHCGHENSEDANFCANCGRPLEVRDDHTTGLLRAEEPEAAMELDRPDPDPSVEGEGAPDLPTTDFSLDELEPGTALLIAVRGPNRGSRFLLDSSLTTVGRHPDADIFLDDITVSRRHAEFVRDAEEFRVHDVGSLNGTYVNGERAEERVLTSGDEVQVGKFKLVAYLAPGQS